MAERPSVCAHCGKRLSKKQWYYRNGKFFCKQRCFREALVKAAEEAAKATPAKAASDTPNAPAADAPKTEAPKAPEGNQPAAASS